MTPLTDNPVVVIETENGEVKSVTTNISPNTRVVIKETTTTTVDDLGTMPYNVTSKAVVAADVVPASIDDLLKS